MAAQKIDGRKITQMILQKAANACQKHKQEIRLPFAEPMNTAPTIGIIAENNLNYSNRGPFAISYLIKCAKEAGFNVVVAYFGSDQEQAALKLLDDWNENPYIDGIVVDHNLNFRLITINEEKDVASYCADSVFDWPYAKAIMYLLHATEQDLTGKHAVVIQSKEDPNRDCVNRLIDAGCAVTQVDSTDPCFRNIVAMADIVVVNENERKLVTASMIKPETILIDLGWNPKEDHADDEMDAFDYLGSIDKDSVINMEHVTYTSPVFGFGLAEAIVLENTIENYRFNRC